MEYHYNKDFLDGRLIVTVLSDGAIIHKKVHVIKSPKTGVELPFKFLVQEKVTSSLRNMVLAEFNVNIGASTKIRIYENREFLLTWWAFN